MQRLCGRPGCSDTASVAYGMRAEDLVFWLDVLPEIPDGGPGVLCRRHADSNRAIIFLQRLLQRRGRGTSSTTAAATVSRLLEYFLPTVFLQSPPRPCANDTMTITVEITVEITMTITVNTIGRDDTTDDCDDHRRVPVLFHRAAIRSNSA